MRVETDFVPLWDKTSWKFLMDFLHLFDARVLTDCNTYVVYMLGLRSKKSALRKVVHGMPGDDFVFLR